MGLHCSVGITRLLANIDQEMLREKRTGKICTRDFRVKILNFCANLIKMQALENSVIVPLKFVVIFVGYFSVCDEAIQ
jgi:hypothetical protein